MSEYRRDPVVNRWAIIRNADQWTPDQYEKEDNSPKDEISPFIYGREHMTPPEVAAFRPSDSEPNKKGWTIRVISNKFPALKIEGDLNLKSNGIFDFSNGVGAHEVLIETPDPIKQMADYSIDEIKLILKMYQQRSIDLARDERFKYITIFKNFGASAGTSLQHAHSQIIALPMIPRLLQEKFDGSESYFREFGRSIYEDILKQEYEDRERIISENDDFVLFCPFVPKYSFECCIMPKRITSNFNELSDSERENLSHILKESLTRLKSCLGNPSYNYYLQTQPTIKHNEASFCWHIEIVPKLNSYPEIEWDTGFHYVRTSPENAARYLREA